MCPPPRVPDVFFCFLLIPPFFDFFPSAPPACLPPLLSASVPSPPPSPCVKRKLRAFNIWCVWIAHKQVSVKSNQVRALVTLCGGVGLDINKPLETNTEYKFCRFRSYLVSDNSRQRPERMKCIWRICVCLTVEAVAYSHYSKMFFFCFSTHNKCRPFCLFLYITSLFGTIIGRFRAETTE